MNMKSSLRDLKIDKKKLQKQVEDKKDGHGEHKSPLAVELTLEWLANPPEDKIQELNYLSSGMLHSLIMLQAFEKQIPRILDQIKERRHWYLERYINRLHRADKWTEELEEQAIEQVKADIEELDNIDLKELFPHQLRYSVYQHSRGKKDNLIDSIVMVTDSAIQRGIEGSGEDEFKQQIRNQ